MTTEIGRISKWNDEKGFGFISPKSGGQSVFFHIHEYSKKHKRPMQGLSVAYRLSKDSKGRPFAANVHPEKGHRSTTKADKQKKFSILICSVFICLLIGLVLLNKLPLFIIVLYPIVSVITFALYAKDKSAAQRGKWRTPEGTLHFFSLAGGWPGAVIAQSHLRHKSTKISFKIVFWFTAIINCGLLWWLIT